MRYRTLGTTDLKVSEISLGCWTLGGPNWNKGRSIGWADVDESEVQKAVDYALDKGVNHFDNADVYGNGKAERMLAKVLGNRNNDVSIATKVGWFLGTAAHAYDPLHIRHQCEQSLKNLNRDYIDLYYFHHPYFGDSDEYLNDAVETMHRLKEEGKIRYIGQSAYSNEDFQRVVPVVKPDVLQSSANYLDDHYLAEGEPVRKLMDERKLSFVAFSPLRQGLLLDKFSKDNPPQFEDGDNRKHSPYFKSEYLAKVEPRLQKIKERFGSSIENLSRVALQYLLHYNVVGGVIPGFRNLKQVKSNLDGMDKPLSDEDFKFIKETFADLEKPSK